MKNPLLRFYRAASAFTLVEMLVVIGIIAILASLLLPAIGRARGKAQVRQALVDMKNIETAITAYKGEYHRFPCEPAAANSGTATKPDFTFGTAFMYGYSTPALLNGVGFEACNSNIINIVRDMDLPPNLPNHALNPRKTEFLTVKSSTLTVTNPPGVDPTGVYRDPWGNPYFITLDINYDGYCLDAFYRKQSVSQIPPAQLPGNGPQGFNGLYNSVANGNNDNYALRAEVMIWSAGPDETFSFSAKADTEPNKDNVLGWRP